MKSGTPNSDRSEDQSSSGVIISTGAGSTGWLSSVFNGAAGVVEPFAGAEASVRKATGWPGMRPNRASACASRS